MAAHRSIRCTWKALSLRQRRNLSSMAATQAGEILKQIQNNIAQNKVLVYSKSWCPYCDEVKKLFQSLKLDFHVIELDKESNGADVQSELANMTGQRTVPSVFVNGTHVGGCDLTKKAHAEGRLLKLYEQ